MDGWRLKKRRAARTRRSLSPRQAPASTAQLDTGTGRMIDHALHTRRVRRNGEAHEERGVFFFFFSCCARLSMRPTASSFPLSSPHAPPPSGAWRGCLPWCVSCWARGERKAHSAARSRGKRAVPLSSRPWPAKVRAYVYSRLQVSLIHSLSLSSNPTPHPQWTTSSPPSSARLPRWRPPPPPRLALKKVVREMVVEAATLPYRHRHHHHVPSLPRRRGRRRRRWASCRHPPGRRRRL